MVKHKDILLHEVRLGDHAVISDYKFKLLCFDLHANSHFKHTLEKKKNAENIFTVTIETLML